MNFARLHLIDVDGEVLENNINYYTMTKYDISNLTDIYNKYLLIDYYCHFGNYYVGILSYHSDLKYKKPCKLNWFSKLFKPNHYRETYEASDFEIYHSQARYDISYNYLRLA